MKIAFIIQRCGPNIHAGAEKLVFQLAQHLSDLFDIEILTTTAQNASTWDNHFKEGIEKIGNFKIRRFSVDKPRDPNYVHLSRFLESHNSNEEKGLEFIDANGPISTNFLQYIQKNKENYDLFIFFGYSYWLTFHGIQLVKEKSLLFPQAHDEPWLYFQIYQRVFAAPIGFIFQTKAEKELVHEKFNFREKPFAITGHGLDLTIGTKNYSKHSIKLPHQYLLYIGRISAGKGCQELSDFFNRYKATHKTDLDLVMIGTLEHKIDNSKAKILQNLSDEEKFYVLSKSSIFIMPSAFESLNLASLEAWLFEKPVIVNGKSKVLKEHCLQGQGGLYYENYEEFVECLDLMLAKEEIAKKLGSNGKSYVTENYNWEKTRKRYSEFISKISKIVV